MTVTATNELQIYLRKSRFQFTPRRTRYDIWAQILASCKQEEKTQSWLLSKLGLSSAKVKESLTFLLSAELMETVESPGIALTKFKTTNKGQEALSTYHLLVDRYFSIYQ